MLFCLVLTASCPSWTDLVRYFMVFHLWKALLAQHLSVSEALLRSTGQVSWHQNCSNHLWKCSITQENDSHQVLRYAWLKGMQSLDPNPSTVFVFNLLRRKQSLESFQNVYFSLFLNKDLLAGCRSPILHVEIIMILYLSNTGGTLQRKISEIEWDSEMLH